MKILETTKFKKQRKKLIQEAEIKALKGAVKFIIEKPDAGKKLKGEFKDLRSYRYKTAGQQRRLIYKVETDCLFLFSFGPREGIYK